MNLGIVGFGRFGELAAKQLRRRMHVMVWDVRDLRKKAAALGVTWGPLPQTASQEFVLLAVPMAEFNTALDNVTPHLKPGALLMDVCSVKVRPIEGMLKRVPEDVEIIGLHPLFGPQSARAGVAGLKIVVCPARSARLHLLQRFFEEMGLVVHITTPEEHDRAMARTLALAQFLAQGLLQAGIEDNLLRTPAFERLREMVEMLRFDTKELFQDMHRLNPFAAEERRRVLEALLKLHRNLESLPRDT